MTLLEAIQARHAVRRYKEQALDAGVLEVLRSRITEINAESGLHIQLVTDEPKAFKGILAYGKFSGVSNYLVMAGVKGHDLEEKVGYYGEQLVLMAQCIGLNTCWVALTFKKIPGTFTLEKDEKVVCYIAIGYGENQGVMHKTKNACDVSNASDMTPAWFGSGVDAALLAPTAVNQQKFRLTYMAPQGDGIHRVKAETLASVMGYTRIDLGIVKCHFEIAAGKENFEWIS